MKIEKEDHTFILALAAIAEQQKPIPDKAMLARIGKELESLKSEVEDA